MAVIRARTSSHRTVVAAALCGVLIAASGELCIGRGVGQAAPSAPAAQAATSTAIEVLNDKKKFSVLTPGHALLVIVKQGGVERIDAHVLDVAGGMVPATAVVFESAKGPFGQGAPVAFPMTIAATAFRATEPGSHDLIGRVDAHDKDGKVVATAAFTLTLVQPERHVAPQTTPIALSVRRSVPFRSVTATHCVQLRVTPPGRMDTPRVEAGELYSATGTTAMVVPGAMVEGRFDACPAEGAAHTSSTRAAGNEQTMLPLVITSTLPAGVTRGSATLALWGPDLKPATVAVQIFAKDLLVWPLVVVLLATLLSNRIHSWLASGRSSSINLADLSQITDELHNLRALRPDVETDAAFREVQRLLAAAARQQERGDVQGAATTIASAREKLDRLLAPPAALAAGLARPRDMAAQIPRTVAPEAPTGGFTANRVLTFSIKGTMPAGNARVEWQILRDDDWRTLDVIGDSGADPAGSRVTTRRPIEMPGVYAVRLVVDGQPEQPTTFRVAPSPTEQLLRRMRQTDHSIDILAAVLTALVTTAAIWELESFGTFRDYVLQFVGAFGVTESVKGFSQVLGAVRKV
jgi:hypothetical protein